MKKKLILVCMLFMMFGVLLTGCMRIEENIQVHKDGSGTLSARILYPKQEMVECLQKLYKVDGKTKTESDIVYEMKEMGYTVVQNGSEEYFAADGQKGDSLTFSSISKFYHMEYANGDDTASVMQALSLSLLRAETTGNDFVSVSETNFKAAIPAINSKINMDDSLQQIFSKDMDEELKKAGLDDMQTQLKKTKLVFSVKFDTKITRFTEGAVLSEDGTKVTFTVPAYPDENLTIEAFCENDIAVEGVTSGIIYGRTVSYQLPENVTASLNGVTVQKTVTSEKSGAYELCMKKADGTQKTVYYEVDKVAPTIKKLTDNGLCGANTKVYISDTQAGIQSITVDGKEISKQQQMDIGEDGKIITYYSMKSFKEGKHTLTAKDKLGNTAVLSFNLDKTAPTVRGVKNKGVYKKTVMVKVSDKSGIQSIKLNGKSIKSGKRITKKGAYKLVAIDKAGNKKVMRFIIKK